MITGVGKILMIRPRKKQKLCITKSSLSIQPAKTVIDTLLISSNKLKERGKQKEMNQ